MVVRRRFSRVLVTLALYALGAGAVAFFMHSAEIGNRGLAAKQLLKIQIYDLNQELDGLRAEHAAWDHRLALLRTDQIDRDYLDEQARILLGRVHRNDVVVVTGP